MSEFLSFKLPDEFIAAYEDRKPDWGFQIGAGNTLGELTFITKYSRRKEDGTKERWHEACRRVVEGYYSILKDHCQQNRTPWNDLKAQKAAQDAYDRLFTFKWTPPGRGLWMMGSSFVHENNNSASLQNCAFISTEKLSAHSVNSATLPFIRLMEMSMLGVGVGFDTKGVGNLEIHEPTEAIQEIVIEDSREGWYESVGTLLESYFFKNRASVEFDYSQIREAGEPINGFGGVAAGPTPLIDLHNAIRVLFTGRTEDRITSTDIVDLMNLIGKCVVAGNVRRSAEIAVGFADDEAFLDLKDFEKNPERMGENGWGFTSNNSIFAEVGDDYRDIVQRIKDNGEPGFLWLDLCKSHGRMIDPPNHKDHRAAGTNPCVAAGTPVATPNGWVAVELVKEGDEITTVLGAGEVVSIEKHENYPICTVKFSDGTEQKVTAAHRFHVRQSTSKGSKTKRWEDKQLKDCSIGDYVRVSSAQIPTNLVELAPGVSSQKEMGFMVGSLLGDGCYSPKTYARNVVKMAVNTDEIEWIEVLEKRFANAGYPWASLDRTEGTKSGNLTSQSEDGVASFVDFSELIPALSHEKRIPEEYVNSNEEFLSGLIDGLISTDGNMNLSSNHPQLRYTTTSQIMAQQVRRIFLMFGAHARIWERDGESTIQGRRVNAKTCYTVIVSGHSLGEILDRVDLSHPKKKSQSVEARLAFNFTGNNWATKIVDIVDEGETADVYDLYEPVSDTWITDGLVSRGCGEQTLESMECCTLVETFPYHHEDLEDYKKTLKHAYLYAKAVTLMATHWPETNEVMQRNRRIGCSVSGVAQFVEDHGWTMLKNWLDEGYSAVQYRDRQYSEWLGVRESIKTTSVKPSGTVSLLAGATPGVHWPTASDTYIRRMRFAKNDPFVPILESAGYHLEEDVMDPKHTLVAELPAQGPQVRTERDVTIWEKTELAVQAARFWADNQVSVTVTFQEHEKDQIAALLSAKDGQLKSLSLLPLLDGGAYAQMPYESITPEMQEQMRADLRPMNWDTLYNGAANDAEGERFCSNDVCELV